jgi:hypothetical protein
MFNRDDDYKYSPCHMILMKLNNGETLDGGVTYIKGNKGIMVRDAHTHVELDVGCYAVFAEMDWNENNFYTENNYCITRYGHGLDDFEDITFMYAKEQILESAFRSAYELGIGTVKTKTLADKGAPDITVAEVNEPANYFF